MKKSVLFVSIFAFCAVLVAGSFSGDGFAKGTKKKAASVEKTTPKATSSSKEGTASSQKTNTVEAKELKANTANTANMLLKSKGTTMAEIMYQISNGGNISSGDVSSPSASSSAAGEQINWQVISGGGGSGSSTNFGLVSVIGQTAVGSGSSTNFGLNHGFLQSFSSGCCDTPGDFNNDLAFNIADVTAGIARIFSGGPAPACLDEADFNSDGSFNIADVTAGIARIFSGGAAPVCGTTGA